MFQTILSKVGESKLSSINHALGKVKDNLVSESGHYIENFKKDAFIVGDFVKGETEKLNENLFHGKMMLQKFVQIEDQEIPITTDEDYSNIEHFHELPHTFKSQTPKRSSSSPIAFIDEYEVDYDETEFEKESFKYFNVSNEEEDDTDCPELVQARIGDIFKRSKDLKLRKLKQKMKEDLSKCTINAEIEAEAWRSCKLQENPVHLFLMKNPNLDATSLTELKKLSNLLELKISDSNVNLLELIEEKDALEQRNDEAEADVKDLMSIM